MHIQGFLSQKQIIIIHLKANNNSGFPHDNSYSWGGAIKLGQTSCIIEKC